QAEDGIRDRNVTGVQTCALPIFGNAGHIPGAVNVPERDLHHPDRTWKTKEEISQIFRDAGITEDNVKDAIVYSGSGNHSALALEIGRASCRESGDSRGRGDGATE